MMYGYKTLSDGTEVAHSELKADGTIKIYIERPIDGGFDHATCWLPSLNWEDIKGFSALEVEILLRIIKEDSNIITEKALNCSHNNNSFLP